MRLLIINYEYPPLGGGAASASWFLARTLVKDGHHVSVMTSAFGVHRGFSYEDGVHVHRIPAMRRWIDRSDMRQMFFFACSGLIAAKRIADKDRVERVIAFFTLPSGIVGYWLKFRCGLPYLVSLRGGDVPGLVPEVSRTHRRIRLLRRGILNSAQAIVANSHGLAQLSEKTDPFPVAVVPNGVDASMFHPPDSRPSDPEDKLQVLFAGRLHSQKNLGLLFEEVARLRNEGASDFSIHVAGDGPLRESWRDHAANLGIGDCTIWHGWLTRPKLIALYQRADCFVNPSLYEGMPNTVLEAMACGLPVIASRIPGHDALVTDGETGVLFALEEPSRLGRALEGFLRDRTAARRMGAMGRAQVLKSFSWSAAAKRYLDLLDEGYRLP